MRRITQAFIATVVLYATSPAFSAPAPAAAVDPCAPPITNPIPCENSKPGNPPSDWDITSGGDPSIVGFATQISVVPGDTVHFKVDTVATSYTIRIFRMGYYGGMGARQLGSTTPSAPLPQTQPACLGDKTVGLTDCGNWAESASWVVPAGSVSGIYFALLHRNDTAAENHIVFVVRNDASTSAVLFKTSDTTWQAYNNYGGNNFYGGQSSGTESNGGAGRAFKISYNRPFLTRNCCAHDWVFGNEYPMVRFLEANGYDVSYFTGVDTARYGSLLLHHKVLLSVGHDEYWSGQERSNVEAARDAGVNLAFFSGNEVFWKTRWENSIDASGAPYRTLVSYKETWAGAVIDPQDPPTWTGTWRDPRFSPPADGGRPENALTGTIYTVNCCSYNIQVPATYAAMRLWRNTAVASLQPGQTATLGANTLGYEWDEELDNGFRPAGLIDLSSTTVSVPQKLQDYGVTVAPGTATHHLTLYRVASGALVFGAGTVQWSWGLDSNHDGTASPVDVTMQQATVNLFADMGTQPATLQSGLVAATQSTDKSPPTTTITAPSPGASIAAGTQLTITGTATDTGGGVVAGVEVSTDGGTSWHPAVGRQNWSYTWVANTAGAISIKSRAVDDSGNIEAVPQAVPITISCPCSIWSNYATPAVTANSDGLAIEVGVKFRTDTDAGAITGIRFYKGATNTGTHVGHLWTASGTLLATATFANETPSGWQQAAFPAPVALTANTTYVASYFAPNGNYAADSDYFVGSGVNSSPLHALKNGDDGPNGVYHYAATGGFPTETFNATNYWVDVVFSSGPDRTPPGVMATWPKDGTTGVPTTGSITVTFTEDVNPASITFVLRDPFGSPVPSSTTYASSTRTATLRPSAPLTTGSSYNASVQAADLAGNAMAPAYWSFTTAGARTCPCTIWSASTTPAIPASPDTGSVEVGVKFRADVSGFISAIRFYKGSSNTGAHVVNLWTNTGTLLASATASADTAAGWQQVSFDGAVPVTANTTYVASYFAPSGHYAVTGRGFLQTGTDSAPLHALASGVDGPNGVFTYALSTIFPSSSYDAGNYWVDVVFNTQGAPDTTPPYVTTTNPVAGASGSSTTGGATATFNEAVQPSSLKVQLRDAANNLVAGTVMYDPVSHSASLQASSALAYSSSYSASAQATDLAGNAMAAPFNWSFTTGPPTCPCSVWQATSVPSPPETSDTGPVELGVKIRADVSGYISGIRFYKGTDNTGPHVGNLWSVSGTLLGSGIYSNETASGWQQVNFGSAVAVTPGTTYVASYFAPNGHYSLTSASFATSGVDAPPLHALANGVDGPDGVFSYAASSTFPTSSYNASNYWVDAVFSMQGSVDTTPPAVASTSPVAGATGVGVGAPIRATFTKAVRVDGINFQLRDTANRLVAGTVKYDLASYTATLQPSVSLAFSASYTAAVQATDIWGNAMTAPVTWSFSTGTPACPCSIWPTGAAPPSPESNDPGSVELGVKFRVDVNGYITGIRFSKGVDNTGVHAGNLWSTNGTLLASANFSNESTSGWQQVNFEGAVPVTAGTTYVASYYAPNGHYAVTGGGFASGGIDAPPLHALANGIDGPNAVYHYGTSAFPSSTYGASNYWVDVVFNTQGTVDTTPPTVTATAPAAGSTGVPAGSAITATFNEAIQVASLNFQLRDSANSPVASGLSYDPVTHTATRQPNATLAFSGSYTASVQATDLAGNVMAAAATWSFTTGGPICPCSIWPSTAAPAESNDAGSVEVGVKFRVDVSGFISGIRFYKAVDNTGTHVGNLWSASGTLLASATFTGETALGWQQVTFGSPVPVSPATTYVASYFAPSGRYSLTSGAFTSSGVDTPPLHALANGADGPNGVFLYGSTSGFPTNSYNASNYWVDVTFKVQ